MNKTVSFTLAIVFITIFSQCASIVSRTQYEVTFNSVPSDALITIMDKKGEQVYQGVTPAKLKLKSGAGYFSKAEYIIKYSKTGYEDITFPVTAQLNGWYFGNIVFGGLIGMLIVDPATGAMYRINNETFNMALQPQDTQASATNLQIYSIEDIPESWKNELIKVK